MPGGGDSPGIDAIMQVLEENGGKKGCLLSARTLELLARRRACLLPCGMADRQTAASAPASATLPRGRSWMCGKETRAGRQAGGGLDRGECEERLGSLAEEAVP